MRRVNPYTAAKDKARHLCNTLFCERARSGRNRKCSTCMMFIWRDKHPLRARFSRIIASANRRQIHFDLTFEEFEKFCDDTSYMLLRGDGTDPDAMTIERSDARQGYCLSNLAVLPRRENGRKGASTDRKLHALWKARFEEDQPF